MAYSPIAFVAPNYRDYKNNWLKAYEPSTTTPKSMSLDSVGNTLVAKLELNKDGFIVSAGQALVMPYISGNYDLWLFPTEAEADANNTSNALRVADDIFAKDALIGDKGLVNSFGTLQEAQNYDKAILGMAFNIAERTTDNGGGAMWDCVDINTVTVNGYWVVACANPALALKLRPDNKASFMPEQLGVTYGGVGVIETEALQATIDFGQEVRDAQGDTDSAFEVQINGYLRIDDTIDCKTRVRFRGVSQARSRIIWAGGRSTKAMLNYGSASWGGLSFIRLQGYDQHAGQDINDAVDNLITYTFVDFMHTHNDAHFAGSYRDMMLLTAGAGENALTNFTMSNIRADSKQVESGYSFLKLTQGLGGKRLVSITGMTIDAKNELMSIIDCSALTSGVSASLSNARLEYNGTTTDQTFAFFKMGGSATLEQAMSNVTLSNVAVYQNGAMNTHALVRPTTTGCCALSIVGCNTSTVNLMYDPTLVKQLVATANSGSVVIGGGYGEKSTTNHVVGKSKFISGNYSDRQNPNTQTIKRGDKVYTNDGVGDYIRSAEDDDLTYAFCSTGFSNVGQINYIGIGSATANIDPSSGSSRMHPKTKVRIEGAGVAGGNLDTHIVSVDNTNNTVTFADTASTVINAKKSLLAISARTVLGFDSYRENLPANPPITSYGTSVYINSLGCTVTWDGTRWMYSSEYACTTANRPSYANSTRNKGLSVFDTTLDKPIWWTGTVWKDATGATV